MNTYIVVDMYTAAFLQSKGYKFTHVVEKREYLTASGMKGYNTKVIFNFPEECRAIVAEFVASSGTNEYNVNAGKLISSIKELKSFVKSV